METYILEISMTNDMDFYVRRNICGVYATLEKAIEAGNKLFKELSSITIYSDDVVSAYIYKKKMDKTDPYTMPVYKWSSVNERWMEDNKNE